MKCNDCIFYDKNAEVSCSMNRYKWLTEEYEEPQVDWAKIEKDTKIVVTTDDGAKVRRYFAFYDSAWGIVNYYTNGTTSWSSDEITSAFPEYVELWKGEGDI